MDKREWVIAIKAVQKNLKRTGSCVFFFRFIYVCVYSFMLKLLFRIIHQLKLSLINDKKIIISCHLIFRVAVGRREEKRKNGFQYNMNFSRESNGDR